MDDLYRDEILEHYREPHNFGTLDAPDAVHEGNNPLCGDRITMMLSLSEEGTVTDVAFIEISPARLKCALLSLDTIQQALRDRDGEGATSEAREVKA